VSLSRLLDTRHSIELLYFYLVFCLVWQALLSAILKRIKGYIKLRIALGALHAALPDATSEELRAYDDECAICRVRFCYSHFLISFQSQTLKIQL